MKKSLLFLLGGAMMCTSIYSSAQNVSTVAGSASAGSAGDGSAATAAQLTTPGGVVLDAAGNMYIADAGNHRIRKVTAAGIISTIAGTGTPGFTGDGAAATAAQIKNPTNVTVDAAGNVYFVDADNDRIRKITPTGTISTYAGNGTLGFMGDGGPATACNLYKPTGIFMDATNVMYIADGYNQRLRKIDASGVISSIAGDGTFAFGGDGGSAMVAALHSPSGVCKDAAGNIYIADKDNNRIRKINTSGIISTIAGKDTMGYSGDGGPATVAKLNKPVGVKVDAAGNVYFVDLGNNKIRKVDAAGVITTIAGAGAAAFGGDGGPATAAQFNFPSDVALDAAGNIYIADQGNNRIRKIKMSSAEVHSVVDQGQALRLFPNPTTGSFTLELPTRVNNATITITDITGRTVDTRTLTTAETTISCTLDHPVAGMYFVKVCTGDGVYCSKLEVQ